MTINNAVSLHNLASGSSANSMLVRCQGTTGLVDTGLPIRRLTSSLQQLGTQPSHVDFVFITHEHSDHVRSLPQLRRLGATVITSRGTAQALGLKSAEYIPAIAWKTLSLAAFDVTPLPVSHDASETMALMLTAGGTTLTVMTDLGCITQDLVEPLVAADTLVVEANHDIDMLRFGPYPHYLKQRVLSRRGHLSNDDCGMALREALERSEKAKMIWLAHLSETNNRPATATASVSRHISGIPVAALPRHETVDLLQVPEAAMAGVAALQRRLWVDS